MTEQTSIELRMHILPADDHLILGLWFTSVQSTDCIDVLHHMRASRPTWACASSCQEATDLGTPCAFPEHHSPYSWLLSRPWQLRPTRMLGRCGVGQEKLALSILLFTARHVALISQTEHSRLLAAKTACSLLISTTCCRIHGAYSRNTGAA